MAAPATFINGVCRQLVAEEAAGLSDRELLERFLSQKDAGAFAALVDRHGPMVLGVCRRAIRDVHLADDAFQAVFLVLARKASSVRKRESLASWLYGVAGRVARNAMRRQARREGHEQQIALLRPAETAAQAAQPWDDLLRVLDEELYRLP